MYTVHTQTHTYKQTDRQTDRQTDTETHIHTNRQTDTDTHTHTHTHTPLAIKLLHVTDRHDSKQHGVLSFLDRRKIRAENQRHSSNQNSQSQKDEQTR